jgi:PAS domain S-box-containing protein
MLALLANWFLGSFIPHGHCYLWKPGLVGLHLVSDSIIALAYYSIPLTLVYFVRKRRDLPFDWIFLLFGAFIVACGTTHIMAVWTLWHPNYWFSGFIKAITAAISLCTAVLLIPLIPKALALPSPAQLEEANRHLESEIRQRTASETRYRTLIETSPNAISVSDLDGKLLFCNRQVAVLHGYERETDIPGMSACELIAPEDRPRAAENLQEILSLGSIKDVEYSMLRKDGSRFPAEFRASLMRDAQGNPQALIGLVQDITQRKSAEEALKKAKEDLAQRVEKRTAQLKQANDHLLIEIQERRLAEEALRQSEERLNLALGAAQMGAWDWDMLSDRVNWSDRVEAIFGLTPGTFGGTYEAVLNCVHPEDRPAVTQAVKRTVETGTNYEVEARVCGPDGTIRWIATLGAVLRDASGKAVRMTGTVRDITKRKQVELALERERQQLRQIITSAPVAMALFDTQMHYLAHSQKWLTVQRLEGQSIIGHSHYEIFPDIPERWKANHQRALQGEVSQRVRMSGNVPMAPKIICVGQFIPGTPLRVKLAAL